MAVSPLVRRLWLPFLFGGLLGIATVLFIACGSQAGSFAAVAVDAGEEARSGLFDATRVDATGGSLGAVSGLVDATADHHRAQQDAQGGAEGDGGHPSSDPDAATDAATLQSSLGKADEGAHDGGEAGCVHQGPPVLDPTTLPPCQCAGAHCLPTPLVPAAAVTLLADCDLPTSKCVPDNFIASGGRFLLPTCVSVGGAEGRCLSTCIPSVEARAAELPQSTCSAGELCSPCYDPISGQTTGACDLSCDPGPMQPPVLFPKCCGDAGTCVPSASVPDAQREQLSAGSCPSNTDNALCAPTEFTQAGGFIPPTCSSIAGGEGRCLSTCLPAIASRASMLPQSSCVPGQKCAPCYDALTGGDTNACHLSNDPGPQRPPFTFPNCCSSRGVCVPASLVPAAQQGLLNRDSCPNDPNQYLCVAPRGFATDPNYKPPSCSAKIFGIFDYTGVCLPDCLPPLGGLEGLILSEGSCTGGDKCAPCTNPLTGQSTGACH